MQLYLQPEEASLLRRILSSYLGDLRMEISNTDSYDMRQSLKREEEQITAIIGRLEQAGAQSS